MVTQLVNWFTNPVHLFALYMVYLAAVDNLPTPDPGDNKLYRFFYGFAHTLAVRLNNLAQLKNIPTAAQLSKTEETVVKETK